MSAREYRTKNESADDDKSGDEGVDGSVDQECG
jgi:hypothetical protein